MEREKGRLGEAFPGWFWLRENLRWDLGPGIVPTARQEKGKSSREFLDLHILPALSEDSGFLLPLGRAFPNVENIPEPFLPGEKT